MKPCVRKCSNPGTWVSISGTLQQRCHHRLIKQDRESPITRQGAKLKKIQRLVGIAGSVEWAVGKNSVNAQVSPDETLESLEAVAKQDGFTSVVSERCL